MRKILSVIGDFFLDKDNNGDEKRFWGNVLIIIAIVYLFLHAPGESTWITVGGLITFGGAFLTVAMKGDTMVPPNQTVQKIVQEVQSSTEQKGP